MHRALLVEKSLLAANAEHALVPDVRVDVQSLAPVEPEADEFFRSTSSPGSASGTRIGRRVEREEQLAAVGMVVGVPEQDARRITRVRAVGGGGIDRVRKNVVAAYRFVAPEQDVALPLRDEDAFGRAALVARVFIDRPRSGRGPAHDLDGA